MLVVRVRVVLLAGLNGAEVVALDLSCLLEPIPDNAFVS